MPNEKQEIRHVNAFLSALFNDEKEYVDASDLGIPTKEPDLKLMIGYKNVGIEHTEMFMDVEEKHLGRRSVHISPKAHSNNVRRIMRDAKRLFEERSKVVLYINVRFRNDYGLTRGGNNPISLAGKKHPRDLDEKIAEFVYNNYERSLLLPDWSVFENYDVESGENRFPEYIENIVISRMPSKYTESVWYGSNGGLVARAFPKIQEMVNKKNKKPCKYSGRFDEIWLLMVEDHSKHESAFNFDQFSPEVNTIDSPYSRVFVFKYAEKEIVELVNTTDISLRWPNVRDERAS